MIRTQNHKIKFCENFFSQNFFQYGGIIHVANIPLIFKEYEQSILKSASFYLIGKILKFYNTFPSVSKKHLCFPPLHTIIHTDGPSNIEVNENVSLIPETLFRKKSSKNRLAMSSISNRAIAASNIITTVKFHTYAHLEEEIKLAMPGSKLITMQLHPYDRKMISVQLKGFL